jgi:hypothetical protein
MRNSGSIRSKQIVFSRWSRKNYAIFCSLGKSIKIARISIEICKVAMLKSSVIREMAQLFTSSQTNEGETSDAASEPPAIIAQLLLCPSNQPSEKSSFGSIIFNNLTKGVCTGMDKIPASAFFYLTV